MSKFGSGVTFGGLPDDNESVTGGMFEGPPTSAPAAPAAGASGVATEGVTRSAASTRGYGRGPVAVDPRKFRYDRTRGKAMPTIAYGVSKADRLDASEAGDLLHRIHCAVGIENEPENVIVAFDKALFFEHTVNGASLLQPGRGFLSVGQSVFELGPIKSMLGNDQRRFFRAYADDIVVVNREVIAAYDPYDPVTSEMHGQLMQVAMERGLQKYPHLAHDSSDAGVRLSMEERSALMVSKRSVLESAPNNVDKVQQRVSVSPVAAAE